MSGIFGTKDNQTVDDPVEILQPGAQPQYIAPSVDYGFDGLMTYANFRYTDPLFLPNIKQFPFKRFRWPGSVSYMFNWQTGLIDDGLHTPCTVDDVRYLINNTGMKMNVVLNLFKPFSDQMQLIDTLKSLGLDFCLEFGNEANNRDNPLKQKFPYAQDYAKFCQTWITQIKTKYPDIKCGVAGGNKPYKPDGIIWNATMLKYCPSLDAFILHSYVKPKYFADANGIIDTAKLEKTCQQEINDSGLKGINKPVWLTEYNVDIQDKTGPTLLPDDSAQFVTYYMSKRYTQLLPSIEQMLVHNIVGDNGIIDIFRNPDTHRMDFKILNTGLAMLRFFKEQ